MAVNKVSPFSVFTQLLFPLSLFLSLIPLYLKSQQTLLMSTAVDTGPRDLNGGRLLSYQSNFSSTLLTSGVTS